MSSSNSDDLLVAAVEGKSASSKKTIGREWLFLVVYSDLLCYFLGTYIILTVSTQWTKNKELNILFYIYVN